jgi:RNA polymerase sigma-70 factor (ECF subfamily)
MDSNLTNSQLDPFVAFVDTHRERAVRVAFRLLGDEQAALDVTQEAFLRASDKLGSLREPVALEAWFWKVLVRQAHNHRRWRKVRRWVPFFESPAAPRLSDPVLRRRIEASLARLTTRQRDAFVLVRLEGFSVEDAAKTLGCASGTLKSHLHRALTALRTDLADVEGP